MNAFEKKLLQRFQTEIADLSEITPGVVIDVYKGGRRKGYIRVGKTYKLYDLASLTKIIFTASACMHYYSENRSELKKPVSIYLPWWKRQTTPTDLLTHTAGLDWWLPFYKKLKGPLRPEHRWEQVKKYLPKLKPKKHKKAVYSDPDMWMIGATLEAATQMSLHDLWLKTADRTGAKGLFFQPGNKPKYPRAQYAPTERSPWHNRVLRGEVHDENTWAMGGVSPSAGLFGDIEALSSWGLGLRKAYLGNSNRFGDPKIVRHFTGRRIPRAVGDWGLGFMKPSRPGASCGKYFSPHSFGHTGFTGTSLWYDPTQDLLVAILSNRVHPTRNNKLFLELRPRIHEWICELLP